MPEWRIIQGAESPFGDEAIVVGVDSSNQVTAMIWNGSAWMPLPLNPLSTVTESFWWGFDVQYEQQSGDAMLVWNNGTGGTNRNFVQHLEWYVVERSNHDYDTVEWRSQADAACRQPELRRDDAGRQQCRQQRLCAGLGWF